VIQTGDSLWSVADQVLSTALGHPPDEDVLGRYWWQLVEVNRSRLPNPEDPDFVMPGFVVTVPAIDTPAR
jgi:hypothetical protein